MAVSIEIMKDYVIKAYPGDRWKLRVQQMENRQIAAIYHNLIERNRFKDRKAKSSRPLSLLPKDPYGNYEQMTIFDYMNNKGEFVL